LSAKKPQQKKSYTKYVLILWLLLIIPPLSITGFIYLVANDVLGPLPTFDELENPKSNLASEIYTADQELLGTYYRENRSNVAFENISPNVVRALVATEDERFYDHSGIDLKSLGRVIYGVATGQMSKGGGSTLTQQLAKMLFHDKPASKIERGFQKFQEWVIATRLERQYTKEEIITMYLNKFDFVNNAVGIKSASRIYFNTSPDSLTLPEAAVLVGMAKNPALFNPVRRPDTVMHRRNVVYAQMLRNKMISREEFDSLKQDSINLKFTRVDHRTGLAPYFREVLRLRLREVFNEKDEEGNYLLAKPDGSPYDLYGDGLRIYTTLNSKMQQYAEEAVKEHLGGELQEIFASKLKSKKMGLFDNRLSDTQAKQILNQAQYRSPRYKSLKAKGFSADSIEISFNTPTNMKVFSWKGEIDTLMTPWDSIKYYKSFLQAGMMSMDPNTGFIKAWVGGIDYRYFNYDHVMQGKRQVGSTFKPIVYSLAIQEGYSPCYKVPNIQTCFDMPDNQPDWCPQNSDNVYGGMISLKYGLANSMNTITSWVMDQFGPKAVINMARKLGIKSHLDEVPSLCLGVADLSVYEITAANSTFVNKGVYVEPIFISRIEDSNGNIIKNFVPERNEALSEETAYAMLSLMQGVVDGAYSDYFDKKVGTGVRLRFKYGFKNEIAGKTGTTQNNSDGWFIGLTPDLVTGTWVGAEDRAIRFSATYYGQGANTGLPIWAKYMQKVYADSALGVSFGPFEKPEKISIELDCDKWERANSSSTFDGDGGFDFDQ